MLTVEHYELIRPKVLIEGLRLPAEGPHRLTLRLSCRRPGLTFHGSGTIIILGVLSHAVRYRRMGSIG
jgi:hypothetical protein